MDETFADIAFDNKSRLVLDHQLLESAIGVLNRALSAEDLLQQGWWAFIFSTSSPGKIGQSLKAMQSSRLVPILRQYGPDIINLGSVPEYSSRDGNLRQAKVWDDKPGLSQEKFLALPIEQKAMVQSDLKALYDRFVCIFFPFVLATDVLGETGDGQQLEKTNDIENQRRYLKAINKAGFIRLAVGVTFADFSRIEFASLVFRNCLKDISLNSVSQQAVVYLRHLTPKEIEDYLRNSQVEIQNSGLVMDLLGSTCQNQHWITRCEVEEIGNPGIYVPASFDSIRDIIAGYPVGLIQKLMKSCQPEGIPQDDKKNLLSASRTFLRNLSGQ